MKRFAGTAAIVLAALGYVPFSSATNIFNVADGNLWDAGNWSDGVLPTNALTNAVVNINAKCGVTLTNFYVTHESGAISQSGFPNTNLKLSGGEWTMNGGSVSARAFTLFKTNTFVVNSGTFQGGNGSDCSITEGSSMILAGGTINVDRHLYVKDATSTLTVSGGVLNVKNDIGCRNFDAGGQLHLGGGSVDAQYLCFGSGSLDVSFGGTTEGSITITNFGGDRASVNNIDIDFSPGTLVSMTLTDPVESGTVGGGDLGWSKVGAETGLPWAEALWGNGRLTFNGSNSTDLGVAWSAATNFGGLGDYNRFSFVSNTLSLVREPPPAGAVITVR